MLSKRLLTVASLVKKGSIVLDVGTDHGYLPAEMCLRGYKGNIIAKDINEDPAYQNNSKNNITLKDHIIKSKLSLLSYQERYEELYHYYVKNLDRVNEMDENSVFFYCKKKLKKLDPNRRNENSYTFRQIVEYKESDFLEHEKNHLLDEKYNEDKNNRCIFKENFPILEIINEVKKYIPSEKSLYSAGIANIYVFKYDNCGRVENKNADYFFVVCFHNTKDILTQTPLILSRISLQFQ